MKRGDKLLLLLFLQLNSIKSTRAHKQEEFESRKRGTKEREKRKVAWPSLAWVTPLSLSLSPPTFSWFLSLIFEIYLRNESFILIYDALRKKLRATSKVNLDRCRRLRVLNKFLRQTIA